MKISSKNKGGDCYEAALKLCHKEVSNVLPKVIEDGMFDEATLWDTSGGSPVKVMSAQGNKMEVHSKEHWNIFKKKGEVQLGEGMIITEKEDENISPEKAAKIIVAKLTGKKRVSKSKTEKAFEKELDKDIALANKNKWILAIPDEWQV